MRRSPAGAVATFRAHGLLIRALFRFGDTRYLTSRVGLRGDGAEAAKYAARLRKLTDNQRGTSGRERLSTLLPCTRPQRSLLVLRHLSLVSSSFVSPFPVHAVLDQGPIYIF